MNKLGRYLMGAAIELVLIASAVAAQTEAGGVPASPPRPGPGQLALRAEYDESAWSDRFTGGRVERAELVAGNSNIELTVDVPAFRLTLWQDGRAVKTYRIGVGQKEYPIIIGTREATEVIWNPAWIPPASDWVTGHKGVRAGEVIKASDPRNPLGKVKIPLGGGYLIHQAQGAGDLGHLVSHGCVRMLLADLYDLAEQINAAYDYPVAAKQIAGAKRTKRALVAALPTPLKVDINYDTLVVEGGVLHIYPDVYDRRTNTVARLREELRAGGVRDSALDDETLEALLSKVTRRTRFVVPVAAVAGGSALTDGRSEPLIGSPKPVSRKRSVKGRAR